MLLTAACGGGDSSDSVSADCKPQFEFPTLEEGELNVAATEYPPRFPTRARSPQVWTARS